MVNEQLLQAEADRIVKEARYHLAQTRNPELLVSVAPTTTLMALRSQQAELMVQAADLKAKYGSDYPRVREVNKQLAPSRPISMAKSPICSSALKRNITPPSTPRNFCRPASTRSSRRHSGSATPPPTTKF